MYKVRNPAIEDAPAGPLDYLGRAVAVLGALDLGLQMYAEEKQRQRDQQQLDWLKQYDPDYYNRLQEYQFTQACQRPGAHCAYRLPDVDAAATLIQRGSDRDVAGLLALVRETNEDPKNLLKELASHRDPMVRGWAVSAIGETIGTAGTDIVKARAKSDRDSDVRDIAIQELLELDIDAARSLAPVYRRRLRSPDRYEPVTAMWALAAIGDTTSLDEIRALGDAATRGLHRNTATVVCMILEGRSHDVLAAIQGHNHDLMPWLVKGARIIATPEARRVLEEGAESLFDDECRAWCQKEAEYLARRSVSAGGRRAS